MIVPPSAQDQAAGRSLLGGGELMNNSVEPAQ